MTAGGDRSMVEDGFSVDVEDKPNEASRSTILYYPKFDFREDDIYTINYNIIIISFPL